MRAVDQFLFIPIGWLMDSELVVQDSRVALCLKEKYTWNRKESKMSKNFKTLRDAMPESVQQASELKTNQMTKDAGFTDEDIEMIAALGDEQFSFEAMQARWRDVPELAPEKQAMHEAMCNSRASSLESMRRRWLSDSFNRGSQTIEEAEASAKAMKKSMERAGILLRAPVEKP